MIWLSGSGLEMRNERSCPAIGRFLVLLALAGCPNKESVRGRSVDGAACPSGQTAYYKDPGCGFAAVPVCAGDNDAFNPEICLCDGRTVRMCAWSTAPYRHLGPCVDAAVKAD